MNFGEFPLKDRQYINGVLAKYMDAYIRKTQVWTPEQMYKSFYEERIQNHRKGFFGPQIRIGDKWVYKNKEAELWLVTPEAGKHIMDMFSRKYAKNKTLARKKDLLVERLRFGPKRNPYDLNFGLKLGHRYEKTEQVEYCSLTPWTIEHVNDQLNTMYGGIDLRYVLNQLCSTDEEISFKDYWIKHYYENPLSPALIPQVFSDRKQYYCYRLGSDYSTSPYDHEDQQLELIFFSFAIINFSKQLRLLIDIQDHASQHTKRQLNYRSTRETLAIKYGWQYCSFDNLQIRPRVAQCFKELKHFFAP
jgi:hypothetical protein